MVYRLYAFHVKGGGLDFQRIVEQWLAVARGWDTAAVDDGVLAVIESQRGHDARDSGPVEGKLGRE